MHDLNLHCSVSRQPLLSVKMHVSLFVALAPIMESVFHMDPYCGLQPVPSRIRWEIHHQRVSCR